MLSSCSLSLTQKAMLSQLWHSVRALRCLPLHQLPPSPRCSSSECHSISKAMMLTVPLVSRNRHLQQDVARMPFKIKGQWGWCRMIRGRESAKPFHKKALLPSHSSIIRSRAGASFWHLKGCTFSECAKIQPCKSRGWLLIFFFFFSITFPGNRCHSAWPTFIQKWPETLQWPNSQTEPNPEVSAVTEKTDRMQKTGTVHSAGDKGRQTADLI